MPMVWYIPPLSPVVDVVKDTGYDAENAVNLFAAIDELRIPIEYLANLFTAGDTDVVADVLRRMAAMRAFMRDINMGVEPDERIPHSVGMGPEEMEDMYRLLAIAKYDERYVIPAGHSEQAHSLEGIGSDCPLNAEGGPGMSEMPDIASSGFAGTTGMSDPLAERSAEEGEERSHLRGRLNLLNWNGKGRPTGLFPSADGPAGA